MVMKEPEEIPDEAREQMFERVCAIDVAKNAGKVCVRLPAASGTGRRVSRVWDVQARSRAVADLAEELVGLLADLVLPAGKLAVWTCSWSTPVMSRTSRAGPRPTSWMRSGWPS